MTLFRRLSLVAYRRLLFLYPADLRCEFGPEMLEMFEEDLAVAGASRVWRIALHEAIRIAVPAWLQIPAVGVSLLSATIAMTLNSPLLIGALRRQSEITPGYALGALALEGVITGLTSFAAVHKWERATPIRLDLR